MDWLEVLVLRTFSGQARSRVAAFEQHNMFKLLIISQLVPFWESRTRMEFLLRKFLAGTNIIYQVRAMPNRNGQSPGFLGDSFHSNLVRPSGGDFAITWQRRRHNLVGRLGKTFNRCFTSMDAPGSRHKRRAASGSSLCLLETPRDQKTCELDKLPILSNSGRDKTCL